VRADRCLDAPRIGRFNPDGSANAIPGHSVALGTLGVFILWLGWFGVNPGSQLAAIGSSADAIALVTVNTNIAAAAGGLIALALSWLRGGKPDLGFTLNGVLAGLVAITEPCAFVTSAASVLNRRPGLRRAGASGERRLGHARAGAVRDRQRAVRDRPVRPAARPAHRRGRMGVWSAGTAFALFAAIKATVGLRVRPEEEIAGLELEEHGVSAYPE
jgi:Amt family ammonium transporter